MKKLLFLTIIAVLLTACLPQTRVADIPHERYTEVVKTVAVQLTKNALLTPSVTPTETPEPTPTITNTPEPTATVPSPTPTWAYHDKGEITAPILVYYNIAGSTADNPGYDPAAQNNVAPDLFRQHISALRQTGYETISMTRLINAILFGAELPEHPIVITFDANSEGIYTQAFPIMKEFGFVGNLFLTANQINQEGMLTVDEIKELMDAGWVVGSRGMNGYDLTSDYNLLSDEVAGSKAALEEKLDTTITLFAYPFGRADDIIFPRVAAWGYEAAVGLSWYRTSKHSDQTIFYLSRYEVLNGETIEQVFTDLPWQPMSLPTMIP